MNVDVVVLAGGLGTRLRPVVADIPKCMAPISGKPFLEYQLNYLGGFGISRVILSVGYKHEVIKDHFGESFSGISIEYAVENEPLGTGGAITNSLSYSRYDRVLVLNGDTMFNIDIVKMNSFYTNSLMSCCLSLKPMRSFDRYGSVILNSDSRIVKFNEKEYCEEGLINGGVYLLDRNILEKTNLPHKFSLEKDYFEKYIETHRIYGYIEDSYFLDIGVPEDFKKAQTEFLKL